MNSMDLHRLGTVLREQRAVIGIPAAEVARRIGVSPTYVWMVERARPRKGGEPSRPSRALLEQWAHVLGMDERYRRQVLLLAGYEEESRPSSPRRFTRAARAPSSMPEPGEPMMDALFSTSPSPRFEPPAQLWPDVIAEDVRETLRYAEEQGRLEETADLLEEYLAFLRHRLEEQHR